MNNSAVSDLGPKLIDIAIAGCENNIRRHTRYITIELFVVVLLLASLFGGIYVLATLQIEQNEKKGSTLINFVDEALEEVDSKRAALTSAHSEQELVVEDEARTKDSVKAAENKVAQSSAMVREAEARLANAKSNVATYITAPLLSDSILYGTSAISIVLLAVFTGLYRAHLREVTRNEQFRLGLMRIQIAAASGGHIGFDSDVRIALLHRTFDVNVTDHHAGRSGEVESPVPGHPTSDAVTVLLNKLLDQVDTILKSRTDKQQ